jgi:hypothetical protein
VLLQPLPLLLLLKLGQVLPGRSLLPLVELLNLLLLTGSRLAAQYISDATCLSKYQGAHAQPTPRTAWQRVANTLLGRLVDPHH